MDKRIEEITHEADTEWFVYLKRGFRLDDAHCFGEDSKADISKTMKRVQVCDCIECKNGTT